MSLGEIRALPVTEYDSWWYFYQIEPWGWHDREYRTASLLWMMFNAASPKKKKKFSDFFRDMPEEILKASRREKAQEEERKRLLGMSPEDRKQYIARQLGILTKRPVVIKNDDSSGDLGQADS